MTPRTRTLLLLLILVSLAAVYYHTRIKNVTPQRPKVARKQTFNLDPKVIEEIEFLIKDVKIPSHENNIKHAIRLDGRIGRKALDKGDDKKALEVYRQVLAISYHNNNLMGIGIAFGSFSRIYSNMNYEAEALKLAMLEYKVGLAMNKPHEYGVSEMRLAQLMHDKNRSAALKWRLKARKSLKGTRYVQDYIGLLKDLANDIQWLGDRTTAMAISEEAWQLANRSGNNRGIKHARTEIALHYARLLEKDGQQQQALNILNNNLKEYTPDRKQSIYYAALTKQLGETHAALGNIDQAKHFYTTAYERYQIKRSLALGDAGRSQVDRLNNNLINRLVDTYLQEQDYYSALAILETNKARTLSDLNTDPEQRRNFQQLIQLKREQTQQRLDLMEQMQDQFDHHATSDLAIAIDFDNETYRQNWFQYEQLLQRQKRELDALRVKLNLRDSTVAPALNAEQIQALQKQMSRDQAILALYASDKNLQVILLTQDRLHYLPSNMAYAEYRRETEKLRTAILNPHFDLYREPAQKLADAIIRPVEKLLDKHIKTLIYSPDGLFARIPLAVLPIGEQFLVERFRLFRVPSLGFFQRQRQAVKVTHGVSCVDPEIYGARLPFQHETGTQLEQLYADRLTSFSGPSCNADNLEQAIAASQQPSFLHIGAHGRFYPNSVMESGVFLSSDQESSVWQAENIAANDLSRFDLITLSSCETGLTHLENQRDVFGIIRALKFAGAHQIIAPLWQVQDQATSALMQQFYQRYANALPAYQALNHAQQSLLQHPDYKHPYYWAGFVLTGGKL